MRDALHHPARFPKACREDQQANQCEPVPVLQARAGERWIHGTADLRVAVGEILNGGFSLASYMRSIRGPKESAIFAWDDPLPGLLDLPLFAYSLGKRAAKLKEP